jgi:L-aminopeptidase/D-esterase-like protein
MLRTASLTDIDGILVGHYTSPHRPTGCTVITSLKPFVAGVDVRGGAPGTRDTELLRAENSLNEIDAIFFSGGSAFGLETATGISRYLEEQGRGFDTRVARVPIVCGAILFDLLLGDPKIRPDAQAGYEAAKAATRDPVSEGSVGAGAGATIGKILGAEYAMKGGLGSWAVVQSNGLKIGALVAVNSLGSVVDPLTGKTIAGVRRKDGKGFIDITKKLREGFQPESPFAANTTLGVVATNAALTKAECTKIAQMAHDAFARCIYPSHMPWDGDTVFAVSTGTLAMCNSMDVGIIGALATDALATAIIRGILKAESWGKFPAAKEYPRQATPSKRKARRLQKSQSV